MFIVFEGIDGSGTTTQAEKLALNLNNFGQKTILTGEPTENIIGKFVREFLQQKKITSPMALQYLFCADRADHVFNTIEPAIKENKIVVSHRYFWSTIAFGMLSCNENDLKEICKYFPKPDIIFYLKISPQQAIKRIESRGNVKELFEKEKTLKKVLENFNKIIQENKETTKIYTLDAEKSIEEIANEAFNITKEFIHKKSPRAASAPSRTKNKTKPEQLTNKAICISTSSKSYVRKKIANKKLNNTKKFIKKK